jgi:hypothetical protein
MTRQDFAATELNGRLFDAPRHEAQKSLPFQA